jgi:hypothetical protein
MAHHAAGSATKCLARRSPAVLIFFDLPIEAKSIFTGEPVLIGQHSLVYREYVFPRDRQCHRELPTRLRWRIAGLLALLFLLLVCRPAAAQVSVATYGAKGDGVTDDTAAIQAGINAVCGTGGGALVLPAPKNFYRVSQPQLPSKAPVFSTPFPDCAHLLIRGEGGRHQLPQFPFPAMTSIVASPGPNPNDAPVFAPTSYTTLENLSISGRNQAVSLYDTINVSFRNVCMSVPTTGRPDNTPLKITNSFWIWYKGGCLMANGSATIPIVIFSGEKSFSGEAPLDGLITMEDIVAAGGGMRYIQRVNQWGTAGNFVFRNITIEDSATDILSFTTENGGSFSEFESLTFDHVSTSDAQGLGAVLSINAPSMPMHFVFMNHVCTLFS